MGLVKAGEGALKSTLTDQWKEAIRCDEMTNEILMMKKTTPTGVISNGSTIIVAPGQCAIIYDNGKVIDATAEEGLYTFDTSSTPSFFAGDFGKSIETAIKEGATDAFKEMWQRFTYNGSSSKQQAVFFFNIKEIMENRFGTATPIPYQDWSHPIVNEMSQKTMPISLEIKCFGKYTFRISNPALFMTELAGVSDIYRKTDLTEQIKSEMIAILQNIVNELGNDEHKIPVLELPSQTDEIKVILEERNYDIFMQKRGLSLVSFIIESVTLSDESKEKIDKYEFSTNTFLQKGRMVDAYANAMEGAANNENGALNGMMGVGIMNMTTDGALKNAANNAFNHESSESADVKYCKKCNHKIENDAKFCPNCGEKI